MNYTSAFAVVAPVGLWSTRLRCPQIHRLDLFVTRWPSTCDAQRNQNSEPKLRPSAVSKSLTRSKLPFPRRPPHRISRSHPLTRRQTHGSDRMNGAERDTVVGSGSLVTLDPGATKREIARSFPVRPWALSQARGA